MLLVVVAVGAIPPAASGARWVVQASPHIGVDTLPQFLDVSCASVTACIAVGHYTDSSDRVVAIAERWDGNRWMIRPVPIPPHSVETSLSSVSCSSANACTAVGTWYDLAGAEGPLVERWDGKRWTAQSLASPTGPAPGVDELTPSGVSCPSADACMAVGDYSNPVMFVERWDGKSWRIEPAPNPDLTLIAGLDLPTSLHALSCTSADACVTVGGYTNGANDEVPAVQRWDGRSWKVEPIPIPQNSRQSNLTGVSCTSTHACVAVGTSSNGNRTLAERWDGTKWMIQPTPTPHMSPKFSLSFMSVSCASPRSCTAVGSYGDDADNLGDFPFAERWNGTGWRIQPMPNPYGTNLLTGVSCPSVNTCTAVSDDGSIESSAPPSSRFTVSRIKTRADGTSTFSVRAPGPGSVDALETAWKDNLAGGDKARIAVLLKPAPHRFVLARAHVRAARHGILTVSVKPNARGRRLVAAHRYRVVLRLWVSYTPAGGRYRTIGFLGLDLPGSCTGHNSVTARHPRTVVRCN